jgi:DNA repair protein SbcC/Rad50
MLGFLKKFFLPDEMATRPAVPAAKLTKLPSKARVVVRQTVQSPIDALAAIKSPHVDVRKAALVAIDDLTVLNDRSQNDGDAAVKRSALAKLKLGMVDATRPVPERVRLLNVLDISMLEFVAKSALEAELRRGALAKINRVGFLGDRASADPDSAIRLELVARIETPNTLERIADAARTKDKALYRAASEKLSGLRFLAGDQGELDARGLAQCAALDLLLRDQSNADLSAKLGVIDRAWTPLAGKVSTPLAARFARARGNLERILNPPIAVLLQPNTLPEGAVEAGAIVLSSGLNLELADALRRISEALTQPNVRLETLDSLQLGADRCYGAMVPSAEDIAAMANIRGQLGTVRASIRASALERQAKADAAASILRTEIKKFSDAVDAGDLAVARALEKALDAKKSPLADTADKRALGDAKAKLGKLLGWERWSANKHRIELSDEAEALAGSGLHPDALQAKITELKARWAELDKLDGLDAEAAKALGIGKRFRALCFAAIKPAQGYFDKRKELRGIKREETETLISRAQTLMTDTATPSPKELLDARGDLAERMRNLDQLDPKARAVLSKQIREINDGLSEKLNAQRKVAETDKRKVIARLRRDLIGAEPPAAIAAAKSAQAEWKNLARADRKVEDELWAELRGLVDPHFESAKQASEKQRVAEAEKAAAAEDIISRTRTLVGEAQAEHSVAAALEKLENEWRAHMQADKPEEAAGGRGRDAGMGGGFGRDDRGGGRERTRGTAGGGRDGDARNIERDRERSKDRAFDAAVAQVQAAVLAVEADKVKIQRQLALQKSALCLELETSWLKADPIDAQASRTRWDALGALPNAQEAPLSKRFEATLAGAESALAPDNTLLESNAARAAALAMALEYLTGRESPDALKAERMQYQVQRLSTKLSQGSSESAAVEIARLGNEWLALGPLSPQARAEFGARIAG